MTLTVHYEPSYLIDGGPDHSGPTLRDVYGENEPNIVEYAAERIGVALMDLNGVWAIVDVANGDVYATSTTDPVELLPWLSEFAAAAKKCDEDLRRDMLQDSCDGCHAEPNERCRWACSSNCE